MRCRYKTNWFFTVCQMLEGKERREMEEWEESAKISKYNPILSNVFCGFSLNTTYQLKKLTNKLSRSLEEYLIHKKTCLLINLQQTSHLSSSLLSPQPSTPLQRIAVDRHLLLPHWNVPLGHVSANERERKWEREISDYYYVIKI